MLHKKSQYNRGEIISKYWERRTIKEALRQFDADASIIMDGDGQHPAHSISDLLSHWENGNEIVCALKASRKDDGKFQIFTSWMFNIFMSKLIGKELAGSSDFMLIDRIIAKAISNRQANATLIRFDVLNFGFNPKRVYFDVQETSRATRWTLASKMKLAMRALLFNTSIAERLLLLFVSLSMIFLFSIVAIVVLAWFFFSAPQGYPTLIILQIFCLLLNMLSFSILAVYLKNILTLSAKNQQHFEHKHKR